MPDAKTTLFICLGIVGVGFVAFWAWTIAQASRAARSTGVRIAPSAYELFVGFVTDFLDTLGIGSFATTTSLYRARRTIDDRLLPGTLNVGHTLPTFAQAFIYIDRVGVEMQTLILMIVAAVAGSLFGAPIVCRWPRRKVQIGMGVALLVVCAIMAYRQFGVSGGTSTGLEGAKLAIGVAANFLLGALMTIGIGLYAPCLVLVSLLGMNADTGFPIMMGSCAFLMPMASVPFIRQRAYSLHAALGLTLAGLPAVLLAAYIVKSLPLYWVKWLVVVVVIYTAIMLLRAAARGEEPHAVKSPEPSQSVV
jgi:uncharacterized membrane protein YfcA